MNTKRESVLGVTIYKMHVSPRYLTEEWRQQFVTVDAKSPVRCFFLFCLNLILMYVFYLEHQLKLDKLWRQLYAFRSWLGC